MLCTLNCVNWLFTSWTTHFCPKQAKPGYCAIYHDVTSICRCFVGQYLLETSPRVYSQGWYALDGRNRPSTARDMLTSVNGCPDGQFMLIAALWPKWTLYIARCANTTSSLQRTHIKGQTGRRICRERSNWCRRLVLGKRPKTLTN